MNNGNRDKDPVCNAVARLLGEHGWNPHPQDPDLLVKTYNTAVGEKDAMARMEHSGYAEWNLRGQYFSEGRNVLEGGHFPVPYMYNDLAIARAVDEFTRSTEATIAGTYAMKLYQDGVRPRVPTPYEMEARVRIMEADQLERERCDRVSPSSGPSM